MPRRYKYQPHDFDLYGNVTFVAPGWIQVPLKEARHAEEKHTIVDKRGTWVRRYWKKDAVVPLEWWAARQERIRRREEAKRRRKYEEELRLKEEQRARTLKALADHAARNGFSVEELAPQRDVLLDHGYFGEVAARELHDLRQAHPKWLDEALSAAETNSRLGGGAYSAWAMGEIPFRKFLALAMKARYRHECTNYDDLLASGLDRSLAREFMEEY